MQFYFIIFVTSTCEPMHAWLNSNLFTVGANYNLYIEKLFIKIPSKGKDTAEQDILIIKTNKL